MSYVFSGKIQSAMFVNPPQNTVIELLYGEGTELTAFHLNVDYSNDEFLAFVDEWPLEKIEKTSRDNAKSNAKAFEKVIATAAASKLAEQRVELHAEHIEQRAKQTQINLTLTSEMVTAFIIENNNDKNMVFDTKLALLETLSTAASREQKMKIRKAKTIAQLYSVYHEYNI
jgi:hypothetical protein|tara:strand:- start:106 stop:621 length:516 start_codon:yes stop_codon:yes gene_type:complete